MSIETGSQRLSHRHVIERALSTPHGNPGSQTVIRDLLDTLDLGIAMARDPDGTIRHWSAGCARLYGWTRDDAIGQRCHDLLQTVFPVPLAEIEAQLLAMGEWTGDLRQTTKAGGQLVVTARKVLRRDTAGAPAAVMESIADVTAQRAAEAKVLKITAQLAHAAKMEALGRLAAGMAHDFNNTLQLLQTGLEMAAMAGDGERPQLLRLAERIGVRGAAVTSRLLAFAYKRELHARPIAPAAALESLAEMLRAVVGPAIDLRVEASVALPPIIADPDQLETSLVNLITNARDAMRGGGRITVRASAAVSPGDPAAPADLPRGKFVRISVTDDGIGMPSEVLARVTEPFFTTKPSGKGTGLGLAMTYGFARQSGGTLSIESREGQGTTVSLWLPRAPLAADDDRVIQGTILLVEDDVELRSLLTIDLERQGYAVAQLGSAEAALACFEASPETVAVITDLALPGGRSGVDLIRALHERRASLPVLLITGDLLAMRAEDASWIARDRRVRTLAKPFAVASLAEHLVRLRAAVATAGPEPATEASGMVGVDGCATAGNPHLTYEAGLAAPRQPP